MLQYQTSGCQTTTFVRFDVRRPMFFDEKEMHMQQNQQKKKDNFLGLCDVLI